MIQHLVIAVVGITGLFGGWVAVQALKRRSDPDFNAGDDVLACASCTDESFCHARLDESAAACPRAQDRGSHHQE